MEFEIKPESRFSFGIKELWHHRELFYYFTLRDIKIRYKQTVLGVLWAILQPLMLMTLFSVFLGRAISSYTTLTLPYDIFALSGLVLWGIFSTGISNAGNSMVNNSNIIRKIYFPRLIIPLSSVLVGLFDFLLTLIIFFIYCLIRNQSPVLSALYLIPLAVLLTCLATFGLGSLLAALNVKFRDFRYVIPFLIQFLLFLSPVIYPTAISSNRYLQWLLNINPMTAPLQLFRASITGDVAQENISIPSILSCIIFFIIGIYYFRRTEAYFADLA